MNIAKKRLTFKEIAIIAKGIDDNFIYGNFLIIQNEYETANFKSLTKKQINKYQKIFGQESIDKTNSRYIAKKLAIALFRRGEVWITDQKCL